MRSLSSTLLAAQASLSVSPAPKLVKTRASVWENRYVPQALSVTGAAAADPFAIAAGGGVLDVYYLHAGNLKTYTVAGSPPHQGTIVTSWATTDTFLAAARQGSTIAVATANTSPGTVTLNLFTGSWAAHTFTPTLASGDSLTGIAACFCPDGRVAVLVTGSTRAYLCLCSAAGVFSGTTTASTDIWSQNATGAAIAYSQAQGGGDLIVAISAGWTSGYSELRIELFGDGAHTPGAWLATPPGDLLSVQLGSGPNYGTVLTAAGMALADTLKVSFLEAFQNPQAGTSSRRNWLTSFLSPAAAASATARDPQPLPLAETNPLTMAFDTSTGTLYFATYQTVYYATAPAPIDLSSRILTFERHTAENQGAATILLDNADGALTPLAFDPESPGDRIQLDQGYLTPTGQETSPDAPLWVTAVQLAGRSGTAVCELLCHDAWYMLLAWQPRRLYFWAQNTNTVLQIIQWLLARAGIPCATPGSPSAQLTRKPAWAIEPPASGAHALHALLDTVPEVLEFTSTGAVLKLPLASDASVYSYSPSSHPILDSRVTNSAQALNHVMVFGRATPTIATPTSISAPTLLAEAIDQPDGLRFAGHALSVTDMQLAGDTAPARAALVLRKAQMIQDAGEVATLPNAGLELWDPITLTDADPGLSSTLRRVRAINTRYSTTQDGGVYTQSVGLMYP